MTMTRTRLLLTASELAMGRIMRAPDHDASTPAAPAASAPAPAQEEAAGDDDFAAFERKVNAPKPKVDDAPPAADDADPTPPAGENGTGEEEVDPEGGDKPRKGKSVQERINEITAEKHDAIRERDEALRKLAEVSAKPEAPKPAEDTPAPAADADPKPDPEKFEFGEADPEFTLALAQWGARQEFKTLSDKQSQEAAVKAEIAQIDTQFRERVTASAEKYPDFKEKVLDTAERNEWPLTEVVGLGIKTSEVGPDVAYYLAENKDEARRIANLHPLQQAREFGRLEAKFLSETKAPTPPKIVTDAPKPPENRARGGGGKFAVDDDTNDFAAFEAKHSRKGK